MNVSELLGPDGPFATELEGFSPRSEQQSMADAVAEAIDDHEILVCEAGTGTGKTLAYLVPALRSGKRVIISTGTKNLQDQLFHRDLPLARRALGIGPGFSITCAFLKGRGNYLCLHRLDRSEGYGPVGPEATDLGRIREWAGRTRTGDIAELSDIPEQAPIWRSVTSTTENCLGQECPRYDDCHVLAARRAAIEADLVVVNHHLFFADMALREEGFGELLPGVDAVIFDEAHQLPEVASRFFGQSISSGQLNELAGDTVTAYRMDAGDMPEVEPAAAAVGEAVQALRASFGRESRRVAWRALYDDETIIAAVSALRGRLADLHDFLEHLRERSKSLDACRKRCAELRARLEVLAEEPTENQVQWLDIQARGFIWHTSPLEIGELFAERVASRPCAWIFTSATLAVGGSFDHFASRLGLAEYRDALWDSPFDFARQALCYLPERMPEPRASGYNDAVLEAALPVLEASRGRAFMLFTSHYALNAAARGLAERTEFRLLIQGSAPRESLLSTFRRSANAVLLGTSSFWEGVDVRGEALSCVIIDKLPFAAPGEPLLQARCEALRVRGEDPFIAYQLPQAVIALKQGAGRLIRDAGDRGVLMLCDPRLYNKAYGGIFLRSLPPIPRTRRLDDVCRFLGEPDAGQDP